VLGEAIFQILEQFGFELRQLIAEHLREIHGV
jgi:hypothetical protein